MKKKVAVIVLVAGLAFATAAMILPISGRITKERAQDTCRSSAEAALDWGIQKLSGEKNGLGLGQGNNMDAAPGQWKVVQTSPDFIVILYEAFGILWRQIFLDGREVAEDAPPSWLGYSTGKWDGDTLVVDTKGFNGKFWLDQQGKPITEALHVIERFRRKDFGHMDIEITIDDPKAYTKPWTFMEHVRLLTDTELMEAICNENNLDLQHLPGGNLR